MPIKRRWLVLAAFFAITIGFSAKAWHDTMRDPIVQRLSVVSDALAQESPPVRIALISDIHVAGPDMPPERAMRIIEQVNTLEADIIAIAGDLVSEKRTATKVYTAEEVAAPLGALKAKYGVVLVPGNHDHWFGWPDLSEQIAQFPQITVLQNTAVQAGPLVIGGVDDAFTRRDDLAATFAAMDKLAGVRIVLTHSPDVFPQVPAGTGLVLAGHTHCGQIGYPWGGSPATMSDYGDRYACGIVEQHGKTLVTTAGIGTSLLPLRLFTQPEIWLIEIRPPQH